MTLGKTPDDEAPWNCTHVQHELRTRRIQGGGIQYTHQCLNCGRAVGSAVSHEKVATLPPYWDEDLVLLHEERCRQWRLRRELTLQQGREARRDAYQRYLQTPEWKARRKAVLERERYVCQGCAVGRAVEVHHLTYSHVGNELLFQLVALCDPCHRRAHEAGGGPNDA